MNALPRVLITAGFTLLLCADLPPRAGAFTEPRQDSPADEREERRWPAGHEPAPWVPPPGQESAAGEAAEGVQQVVIPGTVDPALILACGNGAVDQTELLTNGDFETGTFLGWTVANQPGSGGSFLIDVPGTTTPTSANPTTPNPGGGTAYAVTDMAGPGTHALLQSFTVPPEGHKVTLRFEMFVNDWSGSGPIVNAAGLTHTSGPNQHARVDLLVAGSTPFDTGAGVLATFYLSVDPPPVPHAYTPYAFDLSGVTEPGGSYVLRFAGVETVFVQNVGVDNVSVTASETCDPPGVPAGQPEECRFNCGYCGDGILDRIELLRNGDFELAGLAGWTVSNQAGSGGTFSADAPGTPTPASAHPTAPNPIGGGLYAVMDMVSAGAHALSQSFKVPPSAHRVTLSFRMFVNDWSGSGGVVNAAGLDFTAAPNQHARVDLMIPGSPPLDTGAGVIANYYIGVDPGPLPAPYLSYSLDLTGVAVPGGEYVIRFAGVETLSYLNVGVDNVSIIAEEECDDNNNTPGDGCGAECTAEVCGDGTVDFGETCDPPGVPPGVPDECRADCTFCGDGNVDPATGLVTNGDFEAGVFPPWLTFDQPGSAGTFVLSTPGTPTPTSAHATAPNLNGGSTYAVSDMTGPGAHALLYTFTVPPGLSQVVVSFEMFVNDWSGSGGIVNAAGLNYLAAPNQHARVDLMAAGSGPLDTGAGVLRNLFLGVDGGAPPNPYRHYTFDLTGVALAGGTYVLRFAGVETLAWLNMGVDNVRIVAREECDDGNNVDGDGCSAVCRSECGNGVVNPPVEQCDPPGPLPGGSDCCAAHPTSGCSDPVCQDLVCDQSPACCTVGWSAACETLANSIPLCVSGCMSVSACTAQCCIDSDGDGTCDAADNCPLTPNPGNGPAPFDHRIIPIDVGTFAWQRPANIQWVTGDLPGIGTYVETGTGSLAGANTLGAPGTPLLGSGYWWMVKPDCPPGSWSTGSPMECYPPGVCPPGGRDGSLPPN